MSAPLPPLIRIEHVLTQDVNVYDTTFILGGDTITYVTYKDTITLPDFIQTYFMTQWENSVFITRDVFRFSNKLNGGS